MRIECRGNFPCEVWEISFVSRVFTKKTRVRILCCCFFLLRIIFLHNQEKIKIGYNCCYIPLPRKFRKFSELQGAKRPKERSRVLIFSIKCIVQARRAIFFSEKYGEKTTLDENRMQREFPMRSVGNFLCEQGFHQENPYSNPLLLFFPSAANIFAQSRKNQNWI